MLRQLKRSSFSGDAMMGNGDVKDEPHTGGGDADQLSHTSKGNEDK